MKILLTASALVLSMTAVASAAGPRIASDTLASGPIAVSEGDVVLCNFLNLGPDNITPTEQELNFESLTISPTSTTCPTGTPIVPGTSCTFVWDADNTGAVACIAGFSSPAKTVRAEAQVEGSNGIETAEMR